MEVGGRECRRDEGNKISGVYYAKDWRSGETHSRKIEKSDNRDETNLEHRRKEFKEDYKRRMKMFDALVGSGAVWRGIWEWT